MVVLGGCGCWMGFLWVWNIGLFGHGILGVDLSVCWGLGFRFLFLWDVMYRRTVGVSGTSTWIIAYRMNLFFLSTYERGTPTTSRAACADKWWFWGNLFLRDGIFCASFTPCSSQVGCIWVLLQLLASVFQI